MKQRLGFKRFFRTPFETFESTFLACLFVDVCDFVRKGKSVNQTEKNIGYYLNENDRE